MKQARVFRNIIVVAILFLFYVPLFFLLLKAFIDEGHFSTTWFEQLFQDPSFWSALGNSFVIASLSSVFSIGLAVLTVLDRSQSKLLDQVMLMSLSFPEIVLALSLLSLFVLVKWPLGLFSMIVGHTTLTVSFAYFILSLQMRKLDTALIEAAEDLGASPKTVRNEIIFPWLKGAIVSSFFLCFLLSLDDFLISFFVSGVGQDTLPIKLFSMLKIGVSPKINALSFLILSFSFIVLIIFYPFLKNLRGKVQRS
jgi:spermidine/putrescine transport system permease protein